MMLFIRIYRKYIFIAEKTYNFLTRGKKNILPDGYYDLLHIMVEKRIVQQIRNVKCPDEPTDQVNGKEVQRINKVVWVMWWQLDNIPELISKNMKRLKNHDTYETIIINQSTISNYLDIPETILEEVENSNISFAHFSDFIRMSLLYKYGGMWIDSTVLVANDQWESLLNKEIMTIKNNSSSQFGHKFISKGRWTIYVIGGQAGQKVYKFVRDVLYFYMVNKIEFPDYFLSDYLLDIAVAKNIGGFSEKLRALPDNNPKHDQLDSLMSEPFDSRLYESLTRETSFFKLSYKKNYLKFNNGQNTFFDVLYGEKDNDVS